MTTGVNYWFNEGFDAAWFEFQPGDTLPTVWELIANVRSVCGVSEIDGQAFAAGWLKRAREIQAAAGR